MRAYDRAGIPPEVQPSRATVYRLVEAMDVDYVILGRFTFDGRSFTATAQPLDMQHRKLLSEVTESGGLVDLINVQSAVAWDLYRAIEPTVPVDRQSFVNGTPRCGWMLLKITFAASPPGRTQREFLTSAKPFA